MRTLFAAACVVLSVPIALAEEPAPPWLRLGPYTAYDGVTDDLVTGARRGRHARQAAGIRRSAAPDGRGASPRGLVPVGQRWAGVRAPVRPDVDEATGQKIPRQGRVAGEEYLAYADDGEGKQNVAMLLQIPQNLSSDRRCLVAIPVNGSASLFRDVVDFGYWGLRHGCAVVYTDKGHGDGFDILEQDSVNLLDGRQVPAAEAGRNAHFRADLDDAARAKFLAEWPHRVAFKAAHSKQNPEKDWGEDLLKAIRFAFYQLGQRDPGFTREKTLVIATGSSNGGGAVLYAAERDVTTSAHLIDAVVAREPQVQLKPDDRVVVARGSVEQRGSGRTLLDYFTFGNLYQPCAALAVPDIPLRDRIGFAPNRCASLHDKGLLDADTLERQAKELLDRMHAYGWDADTDVGHAFGYFVAPDSTATKYANDHGRFDVRDRLCGYSYAAVDKDGRPAPVPPAELAQNFAIAPGGAPAGSIDVINDDDPTGPRRSWLSESKSTGRQDYDLDGAICLRGLVTGQSPEAKRVQAGIAEFLASGRLDGKPTIIVHGRNDDRVPVELLFPSLCRAERSAGWPSLSASLYRGDQRRAFRNRPAGLRHANGSAGALSLAGAEPNVGPPDQGRATTREPGGPHDAARRRGRPRPAA